MKPQDPNTLRHYLDARLALLNTSMQLASRQEAFHPAGCQCPPSDYGGEGASPVTMSKYREKLAKIARMVEARCLANLLVKSSAHSTWCVHFIGQWTG
jgi:hypothetical protein